MVGITAADFTGAALADLGRTVVRNVATKTTGNISGKPVFSYGSNTDITGVFLKKTMGYKWQKEGLLADADAYLLVATTTTVTVDDKITVDAETYLVHNVIIRKWGSTPMFRSCALKKYDTGVVGT